MEYATPIIQKIEEIREDRGINIAELARRIEVSRQRLWNVLHLKRHMRIDEFIKICAILDINPRCLITKEMAEKLGSLHKKMDEDFGAGASRFWQTPYLLK